MARVDKRLQNWRSPRMRGQPSVWELEQVRRPIVEDEDRARPRTLRFEWLPFAISANALSWLVDGLILLSAVLLFALICIAMVGGVPAWPLALVVSLGATAVFAVLYRFLFLFWIGGTPGNWMAGITGGGCDGVREVEDRPRFR